jgi:hypothetical protein
MPAGQTHSSQAMDSAHQAPVGKQQNLTERICLTGLALGYGLLLVGLVVLAAEPLLFARLAQERMFVLPLPGAF